MGRKSWFRAVNIRREGMRDTISGERTQTEMVADLVVALLI